MPISPSTTAPTLTTSIPSRVGWGHSTWQEAIRLGKMAGVKRLAIFHHDPDHTDEIMNLIEEEARRTWDNALVARDGMVISLYSSLISDRLRRFYRWKT